MKREEVIKYFWEEFEAYTLGMHKFSTEFKELVNSSILRAIIRAQNKGKTIPLIYKKKETKKLIFGTECKHWDGCDFRGLDCDSEMCSEFEEKECK